MEPLKATSVKIPLTVLKKMYSACKKTGSTQTGFIVEAVREKLKLPPPVVKEK